MIREYKGFHIKPHKDFPLSYIVVTSGKGGSIPEILTSHYTTPTYAKEEIDKYLLNKPIAVEEISTEQPPKKEASNAKKGIKG
jgi:hypothetical protein